MANINIEIPDEIYKTVKLTAIQDDKTVKDFIILKLNEGLQRRNR